MRWSSAAHSEAGRHSLPVDFRKAWFVIVNRSNHPAQASSVRSGSNKGVDYEKSGKVTEKTVITFSACFSCLKLEEL
ncbi:MAG TPA: hypothetical protein ENL07_04120 [Chlorobaculum parvum]|uniref:Uncharacterized protein n=1 Tax=Chlorobaculum parvum TaxID=274539 RepID=A0A7C5H899_9CHLB|nr:hypothetical protein [Chlorobaculum parvum]